MRVNSIKSNNFYMSKNISFMSKEPQKEITRLPEGNVAEANKESVFPISSSLFPVIKKGITHATYITSKGNETIPVNKDGSYTINKDTQTKAYYGKPAIEFLNSKENFENETQVIFPIGSTGTMIKDGKTVEIKENRGVLISKGTNVKIIPDKKSNPPYVLTTENDYDWYKRFDKNSKKYGEALYYSAHAYNGEFSPNIFLDSSLKNGERLKKLDIKIKNVDDWNNLLYKLCDKRDQLDDNEKANIDFVKGMMGKLQKANLLEKGHDSHIRFKKCYTPEFEEHVLKAAFLNDDEMAAIMPIYEQSRNVKMHTKVALKQDASIYGDELVEKMKQKGVIKDNKKDLEHVYWSKTYGNEHEVKTMLQENGFEQEDVEKITEGWKQANLTSYDLSGLEYIDKDLSIYSLDDKINNWTQQKTNWVTSSISASTSDGTAPHVGVSLVQYNKPEIREMREVRVGEALHRHPNEENRKQYEVYLITRGQCALRVVPDENAAQQEINGTKEDDNKGIIILKKGDLAVLEPGIHHCVHSIKGEYEHICTQVPSVFQYGVDFKEQVEDRYNPDEVKERAMEMLQNNNGEQD